MLRADVLAATPEPHLQVSSEPPDLPHPALSRVLAGHSGRVQALAAAPDGSWLASASDDAAVRIWGSGACR